MDGRNLGRISGRKKDEILLGKVKISLLQAVEFPRVARGRGSHIP
jgi:hypothetical protein